MVDGAGRPTSRFVRGSDEEIGSHLAFPFDVDDSPLLERERRREAKVCPLGYLDGTGHSVRFHSAGCVDRIAPQVVDELLVSDHAGDDRSDVHSDADLEWRPTRDRRLHLERHIGQLLGVP